MLIKDERDVIDETLAAAVQWCDRIHVFDNGSTDGTWERIQEFARDNSRVLPFKQDPAPFSQSLRGEIFRHARSTVDVGDWWCVLDSDEIYIDDPRDFLRDIPARYGEVWSSSYQYYFTDRDLQRYEADPAGFLQTPIQERLRYYLNNWSESRFMRHHPGLVWPEDRAGHPVGKRPVGLLRTAPIRIRLKHYQYRSPEQIQSRISAREGVRGSYRHEQDRDWLAHLLGGPVGALKAGPLSWEDRIVPAVSLHYDAGDGVYVAGARLPSIPGDKIGLRRAKHRAASVRWKVMGQLRRGF